VKTPLLLDIETDGRPAQTGELLLVGWCVVGEPVQVIETDGLPPGFKSASAAPLWELLADPERPVVEMTKYDARYLQLQGHDVQGPIYDIQVMAWVLNENQPLSLESLAKRYAGVTMDKRLRRSGGELYFRTDDGRSVDLLDVTSDMPAWEQFKAYCARDVEAEVRVYQRLDELLDETMWKSFFLNECVPLTTALLDMETAGLPIDLVASERLREELETRHAEMASTLLQQGGLPEAFNVNSGPQMSAYLFHPVFELADSLDVGPWAVECLKSCLDGEHEDCWTKGDTVDFAVPESALPIHAVDLLPVGFTSTKVGRTRVDGVYTLKGRGLPGGAKTEKGDRFSTSSPALLTNLMAVQDEWVRELLAYRKVDKALTTYLRKFPKIAVEVGVPGSRPTLPSTESGAGEAPAAYAGQPTSTRVFGRFNQTGTKTGRLSSSEPNLQNIPAHGDLGHRIRELFTAPHGRTLVVGDYSQLEPRLMAHFSLDPHMLAVYRGGSGDIYVDMATGIFGESNPERRSICKTLVLAMGYGAGDSKVGEILTINGIPTSADQGAAYVKELREYYGVFFEWRESVIASVRSRGYVQTLSGRHRRLRAAFADRRNWKNVAYGERQAVNAVVQGSAGDIVNRVLVRGRPVFDAYGLRALAQVHDELLWEGPPTLGKLTARALYDTARVAETGHGFDLNVPLVFEPRWCQNWAQKGTGIELPEDLNEEAHDYEEERAG
jgi:DNA polymerase I-like protein with 3'-5' exonuclease and polymerase domains